MIEHMLSIVSELHSYDIDNASFNGRRIASVLTIMCSLYALIPRYTLLESISYKSISQMLSMLRLMPDMHHKRCLDYEYLIQSDLIPEYYWVVVKETLYGFVSHLSHKKFFQAPEWLYSIPLGHFLAGISYPFKEFNLDPERIEFGDRLFGFASIRSETNSDKNSRYVVVLKSIVAMCIEYVIVFSLRIVETLYDSLEPLTILDPMLLCGFIYICPKQELAKLVSKVDPFISTSFLAKVIRDGGRGLNTKEVTFSYGS